MENTADIMKRLGLKYGNFDEMEKIRIYLEYHPEVFTEEFMELLANRYLNYLTVRKRIKEMWPELCRKKINKINIIPNDYEKIKEKVLKNRES
jgi:replicative superfamily II helicase